MFNTIRKVGAVIMPNITEEKTGLERLAKLLKVIQRIIGRAWT